MTVITKRWSNGWHMVMVTILFTVFLPNPVTPQPQTNFLPNPVTPQPQTNLILRACAQTNATNLPIFSRNLNETFRDIRRQLFDNNTYFATSEQANNTEPVYVLAQCRNYMLASECVECFDFAEMSIRSCAAALGARAVLDGCFLRYEANSFYDQTMFPGNVGLCGNRTSSRQDVFESVVDGLLSNLTIATPKINGFYAATSAPVVGANTSTVYAIAQCAETVSPDGCKNCLQVAYANIKSCATDVTDGRAVDSGCFMRYSASAFFANTKSTDIAPFL